MNQLEVFCCFVVLLYCVGRSEEMSHGCTYCYPQPEGCKFGKYIDSCGCVLCNNQQGRLMDSEETHEQSTKEVTSHNSVADFYKDELSDSKRWTSKKLKRLVERRESLNRILSDIARREMETEKEIFS